MSKMQESTMQEILGPNTTDDHARKVFQRLRACGMVPYARSPGRGCNPWYLVFGQKVGDVVCPMQGNVRHLYTLTDTEYARFSELWGESILDVSELEVVEVKTATFLGVQYST